ncbi:MAG: hypothetical protein J6X61_06485, partial [Clostridia bacterium]|nr:hypothetical protein [Clostridia bacterium]
MLQHLKKTRHKPLIGFVSVCLCALIVLLSLGIQSALADDSLPEQPATTVPIATSQDLINYADEYARGGHNPNDTLQLALSEGSSFVLSAEDGFHGIGTANRPFNGKVEIVDNAVNRFITDQPLFGGITTDAVIVNASDAVRQIEISRLSESDSPLFAAVVMKGATTNSGAWDFCIKADDRDVVNQTAYGFAGVIGTVEEECVLSLDFTHDSVSAAGTPADAKSAGDLGLICNTLGEGAELTFTVTLGSSMSGKTFNVASTGGHAGGAVGVMSDNATLKTGAAYTSYANVSTTGDSKFAGGLVGYATDAALDTTAGTVTLAKSVSGKRGAGGLYGYSESTLASRTFDLEDLTTTSAFTLAGGTDVGILAGTLVAEGNVTVTETGANLGDDTFNQQVKFTGGTNRGGLIGAYENNNLDHILYIHQAKIKVVSGTASGGAVGKFGGSQPVYAKVEYFHLDNDSSGNVDGGLVGNAGTNGSFIDVYHDVIIEGNVGSGLVGTLTTLNSDVGERVGVLRLSGTVDLSAATCATAQLVGTRGNALVYALGSGSDANWTCKRGSSKVDDIGDWGEVVRLGSTSGLSESDLFTAVDTSTHHTITLASYADSMGTLADFVKTALNIQLNGGVNTGALRFAGSARGTILADDLSLTANIDLRNSGILALTRDNGANPAFTGSLNGNSKTVTLAIGEPYGQDSSGNPLTTVGDNNSGTIIGNAGHGYLGLFAKVKDASVSNLTVNGYISACAGKKTSAYRVGGVAASVVSGSTSAPLTLSHVTTAQDIKFYTITSDAALKVYLGGAVGCVEEGVAGTIAVSHSNFNNTITEKLRAALHTEGIGGAIGHVNSVAALTLDFDDISLGGTFNNTVSGSNSYNDVRYGGLIGTIVGNSGSFTRNVTIHDLTVANTVSITTKTNGSDRATLAGTFLGSEWLDTNVTIGTLGSTDGVTLSGPSLTVSSDNTPNMAALVAKATGHWTVNHVQVNSATIKANNAATFGFLVGDGIAGSSALYLDLISDGFHIGSTTLTGTFNVYDEVVGYAVVSGKQIEDNGNAVVSIRTAGGAPLIMTGAGCNTYQNQITSGTKPDTNSNTRYYYNLDVIRAKQEHSAASDGEKLLLWSLNKYANTAIRGNGNGYFSDTFSNYLSGNSNKNCDMAGLSYYPVDASDVTIRNLSVKFYNQEIEDGESGTGNSDGVARSTRTQRTQHYMMHEGIFRDYTGDLTVNGLHLAGNVSNQHGGSASGFLVCGTMGGTNDTDSVTISNLVLDGAQVQRSGTYGPLLIHKIGKNVTFSLAHVSATAGASGDAYPNTNTAAVASSLIGDVGNDTATNINLTFSDIALDARTTSGANTPYGTTRSIFDRATLLNSFRFLSGSLGEYNYNYNEDWPTNHRVTYGKEVSESVEFAGRESHYYDYYGAGDHFTDPTGSCAAAYNFSSGWLRYVWQPYTDGSDLYHEIKVNVMDISLTAGCGQYNDPYRIDNGDMLATVANIISGKPDDGVVVCLPTDIGGNYDMWCTNRTAHTDYVYNNATNHKRFELVSDPTNTYVSTDTVREYLAGAYYSITAAQIELPAGYVGLGYQAPSTWDSANYDCAFAFRGVIVGANDGNSHTILNHSYNPLIKSANGCVVKDVTVATDATITINQANSVAFRYDSDGCASYGAVIGQVMGGDNLLDHVAVDFTSATFTESSNALKRLEPVGGYVGVVVNGGLVFRNMSGLTATGLTAAKCSYVSDAGWLYVNPIVGRVVAGYVFNEVPGGYAASSATLHNGTKNYDIPDLDPNLTMLNVTASAQDNHVVTAPNAQALYVLSCIVNSGAGSATWKASTEQSYAALSGSTLSGWRNTCAT